MTPLWLGGGEIRVPGAMVRSSFDLTMQVDPERQNAMIGQQSRFIATGPSIRLSPTA